MKRTTIVSSFIAGLVIAGSILLAVQPDLATRARAALAQHTGSLGYVVHLNAPGWDALGATEPGLPGISIEHNERLAWGFTILGVDQRDLYVEETDPANPDHYLYTPRSRWRNSLKETVPSNWTCALRGASKSVNACAWTCS
jgi:penicillin G amidase